MGHTLQEYLNTLCWYDKLVAKRLWVCHGKFVSRPGLLQESLPLVTHPTLLGHLLCLIGNEILASSEEAIQILHVQQGVFENKLEIAALLGGYVKIDRVLARFGAKRVEGDLKAICFGA